MLSEVLWPTGFQVRIAAIEMAENNQLNITACGIQERAWCPDCQQPSERINSHYCRHPADLPCGSYAIQLNLTVPRFFCDNEACPRRTFAGKFPELLKPYARRTNRLASRQQQVGFVVGGEAGGRVLDGLGMSTSADTLIRLVRSLAEPVFEIPRVLGVDDWAKRKGQSYGTILVNLETHQVVDLLDERSPESLSQWLEAHPGVEIISRDRGAEYKSGATLGAPEGIQIADRFHLLQNLVETLKRILEKQTNCLRQAARQVAAELKEVPSSPLELEEIAEGQAQIKCKPPTIHQLRFEEVKELQRQGWSQRAAAKQVGLSRETVRKYFEVDSYPQRSPASLPQQSHPIKLISSNDGMRAATTFDSCILSLKGKAIADTT